MNGFLIAILQNGALYIAAAAVMAVLAAIVVIGYKKGMYWLLGIDAVIAVLAIVGSGLIEGLSVLLILLPFTYMTMYCQQQKIGMLRSIAASTCVLAVGCVVSYFLMKEELYALFEKVSEAELNNMLPIVKDYFIQMEYEMSDAEIRDMLMEYTLMSVPAMLIVITAVVSTVTYSFSAIFLNKRYNEKVIYIPFEYWDIARNVGCGATIALIVIMMLSGLQLAWTSILAMIFMMLYIFSFGMVGASATVFFLHEAKLPKYIAWIITFLVLCIFPVLFIIIGFINHLFSIRTTYMFKKGILKIKKIKKNGFDINVLINTVMHPNDENISEGSEDEHSKDEEKSEENNEENEDKNDNDDDKNAF